MTHKYYDYDGHLHEEDNLITEQIAALIYKKSVEMTKILGTYKKHDPHSRFVPTNGSFYD